MNKQRDARGAKESKRLRHAGFTLLEIMIVVCIIGMLAVIAVPNFVHARSVSTQATCINNLRQISSAVTEWALTMKAGPATSVQYSDIQSYLRSQVVCPAGGATFDDSYTVSNVQTAPVCKKVPSGADAHIAPPDVTE